MASTDEPATASRVDWGQLFRFGIVGGLGTVVYYAALWLMVELVGIPVLVATSVAFLLVVLQNYVLHYHWTYVSSQAHRAALPRFIVMSVVGFFINWAIMALGVQGLALNYLLVQAAAIAVVVAWNFLISRLWIFSPQARGARAPG